MKRLGLSVLGLLLLLVSPALALQVPSTHLVSPQWLASHMNNPHLVIVDVRSPKAYRAGHIPHAVNLPKHEYFQKGYFGNIKHVLDTPEKITKVFRNAGISNDSIVIFYSYGRSPKDYALSTREFWTAWMYGLKNIALLHGGLAAWKTAKQPVSTKTYTPPKGNFKVTTMQLSSIATWPDIYYALATHKVQLVDAREPAHYNGTDHDRRLARHGHIPGAVEIGCYTLTKKVDGYYALRGPKGILSILKKHSIDPNKPIIVYCNTGHLATGDWFAFKFIAGAKNIKMYDASLYEYSRMPLPVAK